MFDISKIDKNFAESGKITKDGFDIYDASMTPFKVYGLIRDGERPFVRIPRDVAEKTNEGVFALHRNTAGGRLRFRTNSRRIFLRAYMEQVGRMSHFALCGSSGFDMYFSDSETPQRYYSTFVPPENISDGYEAVREFEDSHEREILIHFPTYSSVERLEIGLDCGASLAPADGYSLAVPVVYYGSSITQGGCCSRPGNAYENTISRVLDCDHVNLGFSGSARGEQVIADYTASLEMSTFVLDYDHNAPTPEHLEATHHNFYKTVRAAHPCIPMIFVSRPQAYPTDDDLRRRDIVRQSYEKALAEGDTKVSFIDGIEMMQGEGAEGLVDACHPTDLGFAVMARRIGDELRRVLG